VANLIQLYRSGIFVYHMGGRYGHEFLTQNDLFLGSSGPKMAQQLDAFSSCSTRNWPRLAHVHSLFLCVWEEGISQVGMPNHQEKPTTPPPPPQPQAAEGGGARPRFPGVGGAHAGGAGYPNPPEAAVPDAATLRDQWRFAVRQYSRWYSHAWGTAILAGAAFFALGWLVKGSNPLPSRAEPHNTNANAVAKEG
jgi:hypothetical protein